MGNITRALASVWLGLLVSSAFGGAPGYLNSSTASDCVVTFNEVMYQPAGGDSGVEWLELHNQLGVDVDLSRWSLEGGVSFQFPTGAVIRAGAYVVVASNPAGLSAAAGGEPVLGPFTGSLANEGERLRLRNLNGRLMDELDYDDQHPWPVGADGSGAALAKRLPRSPSSPPENWAASHELGGTPGRENFPQATDVPGEAVVDTLIAPGARGRWRVPSLADRDAPWTTPAFNDSAWAQGTNGFGFDLSGASPTLRPARFLRLENDLGDSAGSGSPATTQGAPKFVIDHPPLVTNAVSALRLDGVADALVLPETVIPTGYTLSLWVKPASVRPCSLLTLSSDAGPTTHWSHQLRLNSAGQFEHYTFDGGWNLVAGRTIAQPGHWYHVAATAHNGGTARLFVNGTEEGTSDSVGTLWTAGDRWILGSNSGHTGHFLDGWLDEVAIWHEVIPDAQIAGLAAGASPLGGGGLQGLFATDLAGAMFGSNASVWLRLPFTTPVAPHDQLLLRLRYNDGFVAWLNGNEVARRQAPDLLEWNSTSSVPRDPAASAVPETINLSGALGLLRPGAVNVLAVQGLNSAAGNTDFLIQAELTARRGTAQAQAPSLVIGEVPAAGTEPFWCEVQNTGSSPVSLAAGTLRDSTGLAFVWEDEVLDPGQSALAKRPAAAGPVRSGDRLFLLNGNGSILLDAVRIAEIPQARAEVEPRARFLVPSSSTPGEPNAVRLHDEIVINEILYHAPPTYRQPGIPPETARRVLLNWDARWRYEASGTDQGIAWRAVGFDDSAWPTGPGILGFRTGALEQPIRTPLEAGRWTCYFRVPFVVEDPANLVDLALRVLVDDGAVVYLNGSELFRQKMPDGPVTYTTPAINVGDPLITGPHPVDPARLVRGTNWLTAEVHQWNLQSSDLVCGMELSVTGAVTPGTPGTPYAENPTQWLELYNRSEHPVDLTGWRLAQAVDFTFPPGTTLDPGEYLVVSGDATALRLLHPGLRVVGDWDRRLSHRSDQIELLDAHGNPADAVRYHDDHPWPGLADGGGSSLELTDPHADNAVSGAWAASNQRPHSAWRRYVVRARAVEPVFGPPLNGFSELRLGLLNDGECLLDNVTVVEDPDGSRRPLLPNGEFANGGAGWRLLGNHSHSRVEPDPERPGNFVLHVVATDARGYLHNQIEATLKSGAAVAPVLAGREYEIAFDAKWLGGSPQLHTELYYNRVARTVILDQPRVVGTPGQANSTRYDNAGPTYTGLAHEPPVPRTGQPITVRVTAGDPDGVEALTLNYAINEGAWRELAMSRLSGDATSTSEGRTDFQGVIPAQTASGSVIQFYVTGRDSRGATSSCPAAGRDSRALIRVDNRTPGARRKAFHLVLLPKDGALLDTFQNMMSDDRLGATVVADHGEIYYDCGVHLHGSMFSRGGPDSASYNVRFPGDRLFRGAHRTVQLKRRVIQEILAKHVQTQAGLPGMYEDIVQLYSHRAGNAGPARLSLAHYNDVYLASQYENGAEGTLFNMEGIRVAMTTHDGSADGVKLPFPIDWVGNYDISNLGDDPEQYRWSTMIRNNRAKDDYGPYIKMAKAFSLTGTSLQQAVPDVMDVDEWMRVFALLSLFGIGDAYTQGNPHNLNFYVRPSDQRVLALPYDWDFMFALDASAPLWGNQNLSKIISLPVYTRVFHGHLLDLIETVFNADYLAAWTAHYGAIADEDYRSALDRVRSRSQFVRSRLPAKIPFSITSNGGEEFSVTNAVVTLEGRAWIDVRELRIAGRTAPLPLTWLDASRWQVTVPLAPGRNVLTLEAANRRGDVVGRAEIAVSTSAVDDAQRRYLRITEIMYHPAPPTVAEIERCFLDSDEFEFIELGNFGSEPLALEGVRFDRGISFAFAGANLASLGPGQRVLLTANAAATRFRHGEDLPVAGDFQGSLDNGGETLRLLDRYGFVIEEFSYNDENGWPPEADGSGRSLERLDPFVDPAQAVNWQASSRAGGSPGRLELVPPEFAPAEMQNGRLVLRFVTRAGQSYRLLASSGSVFGPWEVVAAVPPRSATESVVITEEPALVGSQRYYRLASP